MITLGLDPALNWPGWAVMVDDALIAAGAVSCTRYVGEPIGHRVKLVAKRVLAEIADVLAPHRALNCITHMAAEIPQVYTRGKSKGDPNDLIPLALVVGEVSGQLGPGVDVWMPTPAEWIGQLPKVTRGDPWASPRGLRIRSRLDADEFRLVEDVRHDAVDAIGLCLAKRGRMDRRRVFAGATPG